MRNKMDIVTKKGDRGKTFLLSGLKVSKDDIRVEALGFLDELSSFLGFAKSQIKCSRRKKIAADLQADLHIIGSEIATDKSGHARLKNIIDLGKISYIEREIGSLQKKCKIDNFSYSGLNSLSAMLDITRAVARRMERIAVALNKKGFLYNKNIIVYLNRLSDLIFVLARSFEPNAGK
ncbi:MAG TPA: cob(I)yrinic acid a,c-diamide adenosyltransferase [Candidatus Omnitrophica bacterium]|nr:cob(I)yrinic acid a,c-diamide adenosyltransferase [Candidatus Omnitrophota bacterium]